ncbi:cysteine-rich protein 2-binding protein [Maniola hyperantus]|uniref:cysteine-rich protein 2-binding protein n=1 Tax=Aphantopus hyperantus TaxID=2795564 RepID=UPI0015681BB3|nr:cysteine-rich protein 2-binding protein [Maniola hyperantus]
MSTTCKYCNEPENKQTRPGLICEICICFVHLDCLRREGTPGDFACDVFFDYKCEDCSPTKEEMFKRNKFPWVNVLLLTLNHLSIHMQGISNHGFFHYKTHICFFIDRYWGLLFGANCKQKKNWIGTIAGALSVYSNLFFRSGSIALGETGWWKLLHSFSPAVAAHINQEMSRDRPKGRSRNQLSMDKALFVAKVTMLGYQEYISNEPEVSLKSLESNAKKRRRLDTDEQGPSDAPELLDLDKMHGTRTQLRGKEWEHFEEPMDSSLIYVTAKDNYNDVESIFTGFTFTPAAAMVQPSDTSSTLSNCESFGSHTPAEPQSEDEKPLDTKKPDQKPKKPDEKPAFPTESLFSTLPNSVDMPWIDKEEEQNEKANLVEITPYEEIQLLKNVENLIPKVKDPNKKAYLCRLKAKLALRRLKRHHHLPVFDLDKTVKILGGYVTEDHRVVMNAERVLDRFQRSYLIDNLCGTIASTNYGTLLLSRIEPTPFRSAYSATSLKPYIRRDATSAPTWLRVMEELLRKTNRHIADYRPPPRASIDFSYVRPQHIAAVNNLCAQFFWPGIDLTEALEYPEFSCVVTYKRVVVACAFLVPDSGHNEAYISFILVRPEWRRAKIASFMLYHLLQTCSDKDVTLHCSPTNPAIFLYQKFGFKVEELIQDFYEKYYDIDHKGCRHALFLRLIR